MKLRDLLESGMFDHENIAVLMDLDVGTAETFTVEVMRGQKCRRWRDEYSDWLYALDLEVRKIGVTGKDACGNLNLIVFHCGTKKIVR